MVGDGERCLLLCFRCDDPSAISSAELERQIIAVFEKVKGGHTFAVIPEISVGKGTSSGGSRDGVPLPKSKAEAFGQALREGRLEVALHGFSHVALRGGLLPPSEFEGLPYDVQLAHLRKGKAILGESLGVSVTTFVPPWNSHDSNTVRAVEELGFTVLSAEVGRPTNSPELCFLPGTCGLGGVRSVVAAFRSSSTRRATLVVVYHPYELLESGDPKAWMKLSEFDQLVTWCAHQPEVRLCSLREMASIIKNSEGIDGPWANARLGATGNVMVDDLLPPNTFITLGTAQARRLLMLRSILLAVWYPGLVFVPALLAFLSVRLASRWRPWAGSVLPWLAVALFLVVLGFGTRAGKMRPRAVHAVLACGSAVVGAWLTSHSLPLF